MHPSAHGGIGTFQRECLDYHYEPLTAAELQTIADDCLEKYHFYRPHEALGGLDIEETSFQRNSPLHSAYPFPIRSVSYK